MEAIISVICRYVQSTSKIEVKTLKIRFEELQRMHVPDWIVTLLDFNVQNAYIYSHLQDELSDICVDVEAQSLFKRKNLHDSAT